MKKTVFTLWVTVFALATSFIVYGIYLNEISDSHIETMVQARVVSLSGFKVQYRDIYPEIRIDYGGLRTIGQADATAQIEGILEEMYVSAGEEVEHGQALCKIHNEDIATAIARANTDIAKANAAYQHAVGVVKKYEWLLSRESISKGELENAKASMAAAEAELNAVKIIKKQFEHQQSHQLVTAPVSGSVLVIYQRTGNFVSKGSPILMISDLRKKMLLTAMLDDEKVKNLMPLDGEFELYIHASSMATKVFENHVKSSVDENTFFGLRITSVFPSMDQNALKRMVKFEIDNDSGILEFGMYMDVKVRKKEAVRTLVVPLKVLAPGDSPSLYIKDKDNKLAVREIETGVYDDNFIEVRGLEEGDIVITSNVAGLKVGTSIEVNIEE